MDTVGLNQLNPTEFSLSNTSSQHGQHIYYATGAKEQASVGVFSGDFQYVDCGFKPRKVVVKSMDAAGPWVTITDPLEESIDNHRDEIEVYLKNKYPEDFI